MSNLFETPERREVMAFLIPYTYVETVMVVTECARWIKGKNAEYRGKADGGYGAGGCSVPDRKRFSGTDGGKPQGEGGRNLAGRWLEFICGSCASN